MSSFIPYGRQSIDDDDIAAMVSALKSDFITQGERVAEFEQALASYAGAVHAVTFSSGTAALHGAYFAAGISAGDEIITSPTTFAATGNAALYLGARPVFADIEPDTGNIDVTLVEAAVTDRTKAVVPMHYAGHAVDLDPLLEIASRRNLVLIEDACHAIGTKYKGRMVGSVSDMTVFSFHPLKAITTGEGGVVLTDNSEYAARMRDFRAHGITKDAERFVNDNAGPWYHEMTALGYNYRLTDFQCALGQSQLGKLDGFIKRRREIAHAYGEAFRDNAWFALPPEKDYTVSSWHIYPIRLKPEYAKRKSSIMTNLFERGIGSQVHYIPLYRHPYYEGLGYEAGLCPNSERFYEEEMCLPMHPHMTAADVQQVVEVVSACMAG